LLSDPAVTLAHRRPRNVPAHRAGPADRTTAIETVGACPQPGISPARPGWPPTPRRATQAHVGADHHLRHGRGRRPQRRWDAQEPETGPASGGHRLRRDPTPTRLQDGLDRWPVRHRRTIVTFLEYVS